MLAGPEHTVRTQSAERTVISGCDHSIGPSPFPSACKFCGLAGRFQQALLCDGLDCIPFSAVTAARSELSLHPHLNLHLNLDSSDSSLRFHRPAILAHVIVIEA